MGRYSSECPPHPTVPIFVYMSLRFSKRVVCVVVNGYLVDLYCLTFYFKVHFCYKILHDKFMKLKNTMVQKNYA